MKEERKIIPIDKLKPNPLLRRENDFEDGYDGDLGQSIDDVGLLHAPIVRPMDEQETEYQIIAGHTRIARLKSKGEKEVECVVKYCDDVKAIDMAIEENEIGKKYHPKDFGRILLKRKEIYLKENPNSQQWGGDKSRQSDKGFVKWYSEKTGLSVWKIYEALATQKLDDGIEIGSEANSEKQKLPPSKAEVISRIPDKNVQKKLAEIAIKKKLSLGKVSKLVERSEKEDDTAELENIDEWYDTHKNILSHSNDLENLLKKQIIFKMPKIETDEVRKSLENLSKSLEGVLKHLR